MGKSYAHHKRCAKKLSSDIYAERLSSDSYAKKLSSDSYAGKNSI